MSSPVTELAMHILEGSKKPATYGTGIVSIGTSDAVRIAAHLTRLGYTRPAPVTPEVSCPERLMDGRNEVRCWLPAGHQGDHR